MPRKRTKRVRLPSRLDTSAATELKETLTKARGADLTLDLTLDADEVRWLGAAAAQVLVAAGAAWRKDGKRLSIAKPTPELADCARLMGLSEQII